ncbi:MAG: hypothetical protein Q8O94_03145 [bacterium]|nr:hypothetical protein [bacterium]
MSIFISYFLDSTSTHTRVRNALIAMELHPDTTQMVELADLTDDVISTVIGLRAKTAKQIKKLRETARRIKIAGELPHGYERIEP